jgi:hypothetical protein
MFHDSNKVTDLEQRDDTGMVTNLESESGEMTDYPSKE